MRIAFLGSRGIPARYSGFETFYEQLAVRLVERGHDVTVYNRSHFIKDVKKEYRGVRIVSLPSIPTKHLDTLTHTALSSLHALFRRYDIVYYCIVGNSPVCWIPRLTGARTLLNVDGEDWAREKWGRFARWYQRRAERLAGHTAQVIIADAQGVRRRYLEKYGQSSVFVPYGANPIHDRSAEPLRKWGLSSGSYFLYVGRFVPENAIHVLIEAFRKVQTDRRLVIIGDAPYADAYKKELHRLAGGDQRIVFTGYVFGEAYESLSSHAYLSVQPSGVQGTRPALLDQMGSGRCVVVRDTEVNMEVLGGAGAWFEDARPVESLTEQLQALDTDRDRVARLGQQARERVQVYYNWDVVTDFYVALFRAVRRGGPLPDYDTFLAAANRS